MSFIYKTVRVIAGETIQVPDGDILAGCTIEPDGHGGFRLCVHILARADGVGYQVIAAKELTQ